MAYGETNQLDESIRAFEKAIALDPDHADNYFGLGLAHQKNADFKLAETAYLKAIKRNPDDMETRLLLGLLYADMGEESKAREQVAKILEKDPTHLRALEILKKLEKE
jgi:tetratricopeptide (TPR) repeat protein